MDRSFASMPDRFPPRGRTPAPTNAYLQERLAESRGHSARALSASLQRGRDDYIFAADDAASRTFATSPPRAHARRPSDGLRNGLGVREMERQMERLSKDNFSLKLEIHHKDEALAKLRVQAQHLAEQVERITVLESTNKELFEVNEELCKELEKRDGALKEAVEMINGMEDQNNQLLNQLSSYSTAPPSQADTGYSSAPRSSSSSMEFKPVPTSMSSQPSQSQSQSPKKRLQSGPKLHITAEEERQPTHTPSLSDKKFTSNALRQLYLSGEESLRTIRNRNSVLSVISSRVPDNDSALPPSPPSPALSDVSELNSAFFGRHTPGASRDAPPHEDHGTSLFARTTTPRPYPQDVTPATPAAPAVGQSRSLEETSLRGSISGPVSLHQDQRPQHYRRNSVQYDTTGQSTMPLYSSPLRSPHIQLPSRQNKGVRSESVSPRSASPASPASQGQSSLPNSPPSARYGGFPTGASITHGTPSRFVRPVPAAANLLFDGEGIADFQSHSSSLHHAATTSVPNKQRKRSLSSSAGSDAKASPPLLRNHTTTSMPNTPHPFAHSNPHRFPPRTLISPPKTRHPLAQNSEYLPYRPASRTGSRPQTPTTHITTNHITTNHPPPVHAASPTSPPPTDIPTLTTPPHQLRDPPHPHSRARNPSFTPLKAARAALASLTPGSGAGAGGGGGGGGGGDAVSLEDRRSEGGSSGRGSAWSWEAEGKEAPSGEGGMGMGVAAGRGSSPAGREGGDGGRKRWLWRRGRERGIEGKGDG
ncbi:MAG: hypothetical protein M1822_003509 [Bathelium mastoideum]|nr:MAG: hypothetical protein M1822_003509 [Bathelium mastoideum]